MIYQIKKENDIKSGVIVEKIFPGKIRKQTQMKDDFVITHLDNKVVKDMDDLLSKLDGKSGGSYARRNLSRYSWQVLLRNRIVKHYFLTIKFT